MDATSHFTTVDANAVAVDAIPRAADDAAEAADENDAREREGAALPRLEAETAGS